MPPIATRDAGGPDGLLAHRLPFATHGAMSAIAGALWGTGECLPHEWYLRYRADTEDPGVVYTVLSYRTPIAWVRADGEVVIPDEWYSVTTSRHQGMCRAWLK